MAQYRKRRVAPGPSKNEEKVRRGQEAGRKPAVLGERFPGVARLILDLTVTSPQDSSVERRTLSFGPGDPLELTQPCPGRCGRGVFDLTEMVTTAVNARQEQASASAVCPEPLFPGLPDICGYKLDCRLTAAYA